MNFKIIKIVLVFLLTYINVFSQVQNPFIVDELSNRKLSKMQKAEFEKFNINAKKLGRLIKEEGLKRGVSFLQDFKSIGKIASIVNDIFCIIQLINNLEIKKQELNIEYIDCIFHLKKRIVFIRLQGVNEILSLITRSGIITTNQGQRLKLYTSCISDLSIIFKELKIVVNKLENDIKKKEKENEMIKKYYSIINNKW